MALRFLEVRLPADVHEEVQGLMEGYDLIDHWHVPAGSQEVHRFLLDASRVERLVDAIRSRFGEGVRIVLMPVEATLPRVEAEPEPKGTAAPTGVPSDVPSDESTVEPADSEPRPREPSRVSREELYEDVGERIVLTPAFLVLAIASTLVACIGLVRDDTVAVIGAMVIAPLLGPNMGLSLATTLADLDLARKALRSGLAGIGLSFLVALGLGLVLDVDPRGAEIVARTTPDLSSVALALASGVAGGLAFTTGLPASLIGVMVAVALLPPLAASGLLVSAGHSRESIGAFLLLGVNLIAVNLAGVATFAAQGIRPAFFSERQRARRAARQALALWTVLLVAFAAGIYAIERGLLD